MGDPWIIGQYDCTWTVSRQDDVAGLEWNPGLEERRPEGGRYWAGTIELGSAADLGWNGTQNDDPGAEF